LSELKESQNRLKLAASVFTYAKEGICITDANGNNIDINDAYCSVTGYLRTGKILGYFNQENIHLIFTMICGIAL